ncbi:MAG TPA: sortase [Patescibacteria group bacterium]|nr:sortase [Patescibacteria group bacterium]
MKRAEVIKFLILRTIGNFLLLFAIFGVLATFGPSLYYEAQYHVMQYRGVKYKVASAEEVSGFGKILESGKLEKETRTQSEVSFSDVATGPKEQILIPIDSNFSILIPKIGANARVFPNVDSSNQDVFLPILQKGVAHAKGTVFPGMKGNIYLFAHSTDNFWDVGRYNAVFYLLKNLQKGDDIIVFFENRRYNYKVVDTGIAEANNVSYIVDSQIQDKETLILQTCWPPGTAWKRVLIFAERK